MAEETIVSSREIYQGRILRLKVNEVRLPNGKVATREIVEHPGAVVMVALDQFERVAMVRQFRSAIGQDLLELPAGTREPGEGPLECAKRELAEETGLQARTWASLTEFYSAPGFCTEKLHLYFATDLRATPSQPDEDERIQREWISLNAVPELIATGQIRDAKSIAGLLMVIERTRSGG